MAVVCYVSTHFLVQKTWVIKKQNVLKVVRAVQNQISVKETDPLHIRSYPRNKIFEDQSRGIVCYRDESGEITCEGYDEGPRFYKPLPVITYRPRDDEIVDLLKRNWLQLSIRESDDSRGQAGEN